MLVSTQTIEKLYLFYKKKMSSECCGAPLRDPWWTWEGLCTECREMSTDVDEDETLDEILNIELQKDIHEEGE